MKRGDLEHIIRAAGSIADTQQLVIIGSQAILGSFQEAPADLTTSQEADIYPLDAPEKADLIDGSIGERSPFHETFGYYAHGVGPETAVLPANWQSRLVPVRNENTCGVTGLCLSAVDLAISKLAAGREKDLQFVTTMLMHRLVAAKQIQEVFGEVENARRESLQPRLQRCLAKVGR